MNAQQTERGESVVRGSVPLSASVTLDLGEFRRGWPVVVASFIGVALSMMALAGTYSIGVLVAPLTSQLGWSRGEVMLAPMLLYAGLIPSSLLVGWIADRYGVRRVTLFSLVALSLSLAAIGTFTGRGLSTFLTIFLVMGFVGGAAGPISYTRSIVCWFTRNRGLALGIVMAGTGMAALVIPPYTSWLVGHYGWRGAYLGLAALPVLITLPAVFFMLKEAPTRATGSDDQAQEVLDGLSFKEGISSYRFWVMVAVFSALTAIVIGIITNLIPMLTDAGYDLDKAVWVTSVWGVSTLIGRVVVGFLLDRYWAPKIAVFVLVPASLACIALIHPQFGIWSTIAAIVVIGAVNGAEFDLVIYMMTRYFGRRSYGMLFAAMYSLYNLFAASGPAIFGFSFDATGSYRAVLTISAVVLFVSTLSLFSLGRYPPAWATAAPGG